MSKLCEHFQQEKQNITPNTQGCEECEKEKLPWSCISMCLTCGHVGCCDKSIGKHAIKHFEKTGHAVTVSLPAKNARWCYIHKEFY